MQSKEEPGMRLHRLGRCVTWNAGGIMSGTVEDMVQSVTSLKSARESITSLCCEKIVFSPLWNQLLNWNQRSVHQITLWIENFFPPCAVGYPPWSAYLATCKLRSLFLITLILPFAVVFICFYFSALRALLQEEILPIWSRKLSTGHLQQTNT